MIEAVWQWVNASWWGWAAAGLLLSCIVLGIAILCLASIAMSRHDDAETGYLASVGNIVPLPSPQRCECAWCGSVVSPGVEPVTHSICELCKAEQLMGVPRRKEGGS